MPSSLMCACLLLATNCVALSLKQAWTPADSVYAARQWCVVPCIVHLLICSANMHLACSTSLLHNCLTLSQLDPCHSSLTLHQHECHLAGLQLMQGICASLQPPDQCSACSSSISALYDSQHTPCIPIPTQPGSAMHSARQAARASPGSSLSQADSIQPRAFRHFLNGQTAPSQEGVTPPSSEARPSTGYQVRECLCCYASFCTYVRPICLSMCKTALKAEDWVYQNWLPGRLFVH